MEKITSKLTTFYPWLVIVLAALLLFYKYLLQVFPSVITDQLMSVFQLTGAGLGNLAACFFYSYLIMQFFSGYLLDRFNMRNIVCISVLISASGALLFGVAHSINMAMLGRVLMGTGAAFATVGYMKTASIYFRADQFAFVSGLLTVGVMLGAVFGEAPLALLIKNEGWNNALFIIFLVGVGISLLFFFIVKNKNSSNLIVISQEKITFAKIRAIFTNPVNWYLTLYSGLAFAPLAVFGGLWGTPFITKAYQISLASAAGYVSMVYVGFGIGGPSFGWLANRYGRNYSWMLIGLSLSFISLLSILYLSPSIPMLIVLTLLFGFGTGGFMLGFAVGKDSNPLYLAATVIALINSGDAICGALSEPFIGKLLDLSTHGMITIPTHFPISAYRFAFLILPFELVLAGVFLFMTKQAVTSRNRVMATTGNASPSTLL